MFSMWYSYPNVLPILNLPPGAPGWGSRSNIEKNAISPKQKQIEGWNLVCIIRNSRYIKYRTGFSLGPMVHALGVGCWGSRGSKKNVFRTWSYSVTNWSGWWIKCIALKILSLGCTGGGIVGVWWGSIFFSSEPGCVAYQIEQDDE